MNKNKLKYIIFVLACITLIAIDQITKSLALKYLYSKEPVVLINNVLELTYVENRGAAFGILQNKQILFSILTVVVLVYLLFLLHKTSLCKRNMPLYIFIILIFSGAIGNFIDRVRNKYVVDMIYFKPIDFPVFNFADICITIGCVLLIYSLIFVDKD